MTIKEKALWQIMKYLGNKKVFKSESTAQAELKKCARENKKSYHLPLKYKKVAKKCVFENKLFHPMTYFATTGSSTAIIYLHGGAFCTQPNSFHWNFVKDLHEKTNASIYLPLYPLSPKSNYKTTYNTLRNFYEFISQKHKKIYLIGDSAGGTLALGLAHILMNEPLPKPEAVIPLSPVVDVTFTNKKMGYYEKFDPMLSKEGARYICQKWARGGNFANPIISPLYGDYNGYPNIYLFYGNYEILCPDLREFVKKVEAQNCNIFSVEQNKCMHCYPLMPVPKGEDARDLIASVITQKAFACELKRNDDKHLVQKVEMENTK